MIRITPIPAVRSFPHLVLAVLAAGTLLVPARATHAAGTPEQTCQKGRYSAAAQYSACQLKALAKFFGGSEDITKYEAASLKCRTKYAAVWPKLQAKAPGSTCDAARFTDNGDGTVTDRQTGLQWETKQNQDTVQNLADPHDADNGYTWTALPSGTVADGTTFATFLPALNSGGCFAGQCDWRLPTSAELQTILSEALPCPTTLCIDPIFGPTSAANPYWSATTFTTFPSSARFVTFVGGDVGANVQTGLNAVRAVRAGL